MSELVFLIGGARSGKSRLALRIARATGLPVVFVATGWAADAEMESRIARHRAERPPGWETVERPRDLAGSLSALPNGSCAIVDCLSFWVHGLIEDGASDERADHLAALAASAALAHQGPVIAVSNEVGQGVVPASASGRRYRDVLGRVNARWAELAQTAALVVAGRAVPLSTADWLTEELDR
ncbi:MAG TPA: bifunctional adenosylcobinamide kinase/adenosylcobinamide-phosphate guanylyltransferase [Solirubrobacteraceae bacterium]|nr:bifunctional adenosylcobinamide kinase/adenosylcobinamide-phosphate guanylyltransferase [Solirubrobacteraceae bacterium]